MIDNHSGYSKRVLIPCDCAGTCGYLVFERFDDHEKDVDPDQWYVEFYDSYPKNWQLKDRLKNAWNALRGRDYWTHTYVFHAPTMKKAIEELNEIQEPVQEEKA